MKRLIIFITFLILLSSCSHMKSGHYVQVRSGDSKDSLSKEFDVPMWAIDAANKGKKFSKGDWVLIPLNWGVVGVQNGYSSYAETQAFLSSGEFMWPVPATQKISSKYGTRRGRMHEGIDIPARTGSHILAANDGVVVYSSNGMGGYGNTTVISHAYGYFTVYAHAHRNYVSRGDKVYRGQVIAQVGNTGRSTGPHLHFEIRKNSKSINPLAVVKRPSSRGRRVASK